MGRIYMNDTELAIKLAGIFPVINVAKEMNAVDIAKAVYEGGIEVIELVYGEQSGSAVSAIVGEIPQMIVGVGNVNSVEEARQCKEAGAKFVFTSSADAAVVEYCRSADLVCVPNCANAAEISSARSKGIQIVRFSPAELSGGVQAIKAFSAAFPDVNYIVSGGVGYGNMHEYLDQFKVLAIECDFIFTPPMMYLADYAGIKKSVEQALITMFDFSVGHVGINGKDNGAQVARDTASRLEELFAYRQYPGSANIFSDEKFEILTLIDVGVHGHIQNLCSSVERAVPYIRKRGAKFNEMSKYLPVYSKSPIVETTTTWELDEKQAKLEFSRFNPEKYVFLRYIVEEEIGGLAFHLGRKLYA